MDAGMKLIIAALALLVIGVGVALLMVAGLLESTLALFSIGFVSSTVGFITGFIGIARYMRSRR